MKLLIQPDDGAAPLIEAISQAQQSIDMYVFRLDHPEVEAALVVLEKTAATYAPTSNRA